MGQAKQRGTKEERVAQAIEKRYIAVMEEANERPQELIYCPTGRPQGKSYAALMLAAAVAFGSGAFTSYADKKD